MVAAVLNQRSVLNIERAVLDTGRKDKDDYTAANFELYGGQLALVRLERLGQVSAFADACVGLREPAEGRVCFLGRDWRDFSIDTANMLRGRIGRVFSAGGWLEDFSVAENILLARRHHAPRPDEGLREEAALLAVKLGLPGLPLGHPKDYDRKDLRLAGCVRAFLGAPVLLVLEDPTFGLHPSTEPALINSILEACGRGAAVIWITLSKDVWQDDSLPVDRHLTFFGHDLKEIER